MKTNYLFLIVLLLTIGIQVNLKSQTVLCDKTASNWSPIQTYPNLPVATYYHAAAWLDNTLYVQAPTSSGAGATTIYKYTYGSNWTIGTPCLTPVAGASMTACNGKLYLIGGNTSYNVGGTNVQEYDPNTNTWTAKSPLPQALSGHGSVCWGDSVIFVIGGPWISAASNLNIYYYRASSDTWGTITNSLPSGQGRRGFALALTNGNKIIMSCGYNTSYLNSTYIGTIGANATQINWITGANAPLALSRCGGGAYDTTFFLVGGSTSISRNDTVFLFDIINNLWNYRIVNNPHPVENIFNAVTVKCLNDTVRIFQPGGLNASSNSIASFDVTGYGGIITKIDDKANSLSSILYPNYPNPFYQKTNITYQLKSNSDVSLKVYDKLGILVCILVNAKQTPGKYEVPFEAKNLLPDIYFLILTTNNTSQTKKMILLR